MLNVTGSTKIVPLVTGCLEQPKPFSAYEQVLKVTDAKSSQGRERRGPPRTSIPEVGVTGHDGRWHLGHFVMVVREGWNRRRQCRVAMGEEGGFVFPKCVLSIHV